MRLSGTALHAGGEVSVELEAHAGPIVWCLGGRELDARSLSLLRTDRGVAIGAADGSASVDLAEHLLSAMGGLGVRRGLRVRTDSAELPLLDGGAQVFSSALLALPIERGLPPTLHVVRPFHFERGGSTLSLTPGEAVEAVVEVDFPPPIGRERASWDGSPARYLSDIAPARTFGWLSEADALLAAGRARGATLGPVVVLTPEGPLGPGPEPNECARHKLLDLIGDLALYGGPPRGRVHAVRPGHTTTHAAMREALRSGAVLRVELETDA